MSLSQFSRCLRQVPTAKGLIGVRSSHQAGHGQAEQSGSHSLHLKMYGAELCSPSTPQLAQASLGAFLSPDSDLHALILSARIVRKWLLGSPAQLRPAGSSAAELG